MTRIRNGSRSWKSGGRGAPGRMEERGGAAMGTERREMERLAERVELQMEDVKAMVSEIWTTMAAIVEAQKKILERVEQVERMQGICEVEISKTREAQEEIRKKAGSIEAELMESGTIETAARNEQREAMAAIREAQKGHTAALQTMNKVMKGVLMVMRGSCRE